MRKILFLMLLALPLVIQGCSNGASVTVKEIGVTIAAQGVTTLDQSQQVGLTATVTNDTNSQGVSWALSGTGCTGAACGTLTGSTTAATTYNAPASVTGITSVTVTATSIADTTKFASITVSVAALPAITIASLPSVTAGSAYPSTTLTETGGAGTLTWSVSAGTLPPGLNLNSSTGVITGTPTTPGTYNFTLKVTDSGNPAQSATKPETIVVNPVMLAVSTTTLPSGLVGAAYSSSVASTGGTGAVTWTITSGALPAGLNLNASTGEITGTPTASGTASFTVKATDSGSPAQTATKALTITINATLAVSTTSLPNGTVGTAYGATLGATGGTGAVTWTISAGALPAGLNLNASTGAISGTPTAAGTVNFTVKATDLSSPAQTATKGLSITIAATTLTVTTTSLPDGLVGSAYSNAVGSSGGTGTVTWTISAGALPAGLSIDSQGTIAGTPTAAGTANFTVKATDSGSPAQTATKALSITINPATLVITTTTLPNGTVGTVYNQTVMQSGGTAPFLWTIKSGSGSLPAGLTLNNSTGNIGGTPTATGTSNFTIQVADSGSPGQTVTQALSITIGAGANNNAPLNGQYTFLAANGVQQVAGTFTADGAGNLSNCLLDFNDVNAGPLTNAPCTGLYTLGHDHRGMLYIATPTTGTMSFSIAVAVDGTGNTQKGVMATHSPTATKMISGEFKKQAAGPFTLAAIAGNYAFGMEGRDGSNIREAFAGDFTLASNGTISAGQLDHLGGGNDANVAFTGTASAISGGRGTVSISSSLGTFNYAYYPVSTTESFLISLDGAGGFPLVQGEMLQQSGRPFGASAFSAPMTFAADADSTVSGTSVRTGTITLLSTPNTLTMTYIGANGSLPDANSGFITYSVSANGRVTTTDSVTSATSVFYLVSANKGFIIGGSVAAADASIKVLGKFEPQSGGPFATSLLNGDYIFGSVAPPNTGGVVYTGIVHFDGAGNATVTTDSADSTAFTVTTGTPTTWSATQNGSGSPLFLIQSNATEFWALTLVSPGKAFYAPNVPPIAYSSLFILEQ